MSNPAGTVWTVFNGEIFNHVELRASLEAAGHTFRTRSDTEVIVHLYERYGDRFVEHLNAQFATALWDRTRRLLVLARDRAGIRPLLRASAKRRLRFAHATKALLAVLPECAQIDALALAQALTYGSTPEPGTIHRGIQSMATGCMLAIEHERSETL